MYNEIGFLSLVLLLGEIRYYLTRYSRDVPPVLDWLFVRADFGRDCKKPLNKLVPNMQFRHISGALMRVYSKEWEDGSKRLRVEKVISPKIPMKDMIENALKDAVTP